MNLVLSLPYDQTNIKNIISDRDFDISFQDSKENSCQKLLIKQTNKREAFWRQISPGYQQSSGSLLTSRQKITSQDDYLDYQSRFGTKKRASYRFIDLNNLNTNSFVSTVVSIPTIESNSPLKIHQIKITKSTPDSSNYNPSQSSSYHLDVVEPFIQTRSAALNKDTLKITTNTQPQMNKSFKKNCPHTSQIIKELQNKETQDSYKVSESLLDLIQVKFCLYLQSEYKILKNNNINKQKSVINQHIFESLFKKKPRIDLPPNDVRNQEDITQTNTQIQRKPHNFNMSKYFMAFLIRLFDRDHLEELHLETQIVQEFLNRFMKDFERASQKNETSKTHYFNHNHFDLLFLQLNQQTFQKICQNQQLLEMHLHLFQVTDIKQKDAWIQINYFKEQLARIALAQLDVLTLTSSDQIQALDIPEIKKLDFLSKIHYFYRVKKAIAQLRCGRTVYRF